MVEIKTKDKLENGIKTLDKSQIAGNKMKSAFIKSRQKVNKTIDCNEDSAEEYASNRLEESSKNIGSNVVNAFDNVGRKSYEKTKGDILDSRESFENFKRERAIQSLEKQRENVISPYYPKTNEKIPIENDTRIKSKGNSNIKFKERPTLNRQKENMRIRNGTKLSVKDNLKATDKVISNGSINGSKKLLEQGKDISYSSVKGIKSTGRAIKNTIKSIIASGKTLITGLIAGGWVAVSIILLVCLSALLFSSVFGIFFAGEEKDGVMTLHSVVEEINQDYEEVIEAEKTGVAYDICETMGDGPGWKDVLAIYAVKVNTDGENPQEIVTMNDHKKSLLSLIFWEMNEVKSHLGTITFDGVKEQVLFIDLSHKSVNEMAEEYNFSEKQKEYLKELLKEENDELWETILK